MSKIYIVDYGLSGCKTANDKINKFLIGKGWKCTGFNTTYWKDVTCECDIKNQEKELRNQIQSIATGCTLSLLIVCVDKSDVIGTKADEMIFFGYNCDFIHPDSNNEDSK